MGRADPGWTMFVFAVGILLIFVLILVSITEPGREAWEAGVKVAGRLARGG